MLENFFSQTLPQAMHSYSPLTLVLVYVGGIVTSLSPCVLTMMPVMVGYAGGYGETRPKSRLRGFSMSFTVVLGMSLTFALIGAAAVSVGRIFGQYGPGWYYFLAAVAIIMGLQLLGVINIRFPAVAAKPLKKGGFLPSFLLGLMFGLVMSPCATPVLAVIVAFVASTGNFLYGALLLFVYGLGHGLPLILVGTFTAAIKGLSKVRVYGHYLNLASGVILILLGLYFLVLVRWY